MAKEIIELIRLLTPFDNGWLNALIQAAALELILALLIPVLGSVVEAVIVKGVRGAASKALGIKMEYIISNYILAAGVIIHELSHALFALLTGAKVTEVALFKPDGNSLGHVCYCTRGPAVSSALQNCLGSCAPVVTGLILSALMVTKVYPSLTVAWQKWFAIYLLVSMVFHMNMSEADLKNYFKGAGVLILFALPFCFLYMLLF